MLRVQIIDMHRLLWGYTSDDPKHNISDALLEEYIVNDGTLDQCRELIWEGDGKRVAEGFIVATVSCQGATIGSYQNKSAYRAACYEAVAKPGITRYQWELTTDSSFIIILGHGTNTESFTFGPDAQYAYISCKQFLAGCGWSNTAIQRSHFHDDCCRQWSIGPNPTHRPIELRSYQADGGESSLLRTATKASTATLRHVQVFISDGRLVLELHYPIGTAYAHLDLSLLRQGTYHLLINGTEHHVVVRE